MVPAEYRKEILTTNMIAKATASASDQSMFQLFTIWKNYIEPDGDFNLECGFCLQRILQNWIGMQATLIELEKEDQLMNSI